MLARFCCSQNRSIPVAVLKYIIIVLDGRTAGVRCHEPRRCKGIGTPTEGTNFAFGDEPFERPDYGIRLGDTDIADVKLVKIDMVGLKTLERCVQSALDIGRVVADSLDGLGCFITDEAEFRRENHAITTTFESDAEELFTVSDTVAIGGVDEIDTEVERRLNRLDRFIIIGIAVAVVFPVEKKLPADGPATDAHRTDLKTGSSQNSLFHNKYPPHIFSLFICANLPFGRQWPIKIVSLFFSKPGRKQARFFFATTSPTGSRSSKWQSRNPCSQGRHPYPLSPSTG